MSRVFFVWQVGPRYTEVPTKTSLLTAAEGCTAGEKRNTQSTQQANAVDATSIFKLWKPKFCFNLSFNTSHAFATSYCQTTLHALNLTTVHCFCLGNESDAVR